jgi:hypothetical protein
MNLGAEIADWTLGAHVVNDCVPGAGTSASGTGGLACQRNTHMYGKLT